MREPLDSDDPLVLAAELFELAKSTETDDPTRFVLATVGESGPSARFLLLKHLDSRGFGFVTNRQSRKGRELAADPRAAIAMHWPSIDVQIRAEGRVIEAAVSDSDAYFASRPRESQIGAWASPQSEVIASRDDLDARVREFTTRFVGQDVPRPPHWGLCHLVPDAVELWYGKPSRLHDRHRFERMPDGRYRRTRLAP